MNTKLKFAGIDPFLATNIITPDERLNNRKGWVEFGDGNQYPNYIHDLYEHCATLHSIIHGSNDFITGDEIVSNVINFSDKQITELVEDIGLSMLIYGGAYLEVVRNRVGNIAQVNVLNFRNVRTNVNNDTFYYNTSFSESRGRTKSDIILPKFDPNDKNQAHSVFMIKNSSHSVYPTPLWSASDIAATIEKNINLFHLNNLANGFTSTTIVNFNNGEPTDEMKKEIERMFNEKFAGYQNAGRMMLSWNDDKDHAATIDTLDMKDYGEQYATLAERSRNELFVAFRATPILFGLPLDNIGFNVQEYQSAFKLFNKTVIQPLQRKIVYALDTVFKGIIKEGNEHALTITPFTIEFE